MPEVRERPIPLSPEESDRLIDLARALKAAARAVQMYPSGHPAITTTLARVVELTSPAHLTAPSRISVLPDGLLLAGRAPARRDAAVEELAALLHSHAIGALTVTAGGDPEVWRSFLLLLARTPEAVRSEGGIARVWATTAGQHVQLREIDYGQVLRERAAGLAAVWDRVITNCLEGNVLEFDEADLRHLLEVADDGEQLADLVKELEARAQSEEGGLAVRAAAVLRMLRGIVDAVSSTRPDRLEPVLRNMAAAFGELSPDTVAALLAIGEGPDEGPRLVNAVVNRMSDGTIAQFVARNVVAASTATDRLVVAFQALVKDNADRKRLLALARHDVAASPLGSTEGFDGVWNLVVEKLITSYSDKSYVSDEYARELSRAPARAVEVEQTSDDPPERIAAWLSTVATTSLRGLDLALVVDLLRLEKDDDRWGELTQPVVDLIDDLLLVGDFDAAAQLVGVLTKEASGPESPRRRQFAITAIDTLVAGPMMRHVVGYLATTDESQFERVKAICLSLGEVVVKPLAEALSTEERGRARQRLTAILLAFGVVGKRTAERLKSSANAAVRRTAIYLLREFGGSEALPELTELLDDDEPQVQREAVRAILNIGTEQAYGVLERALVTGTDRSRDAIMQALSLIRDERATPLFTYIVRHVNHRGPLVEVYLRAIQSLGALRDPDAIPTLKEALYRGEWWARRRNAILRSAAAEALARIGTPESQSVLNEAMLSAPRSVRSIARQYLNAPLPRVRAPGGRP